MREPPTSGWTDAGRNEHVYPVRVFYEDTDAAGIVYYVNHLKFAERARTEMLRLLGAEQRQMLEDDGLGFTVRRCEVEYLAPARLDDALEVVTTLLSVGGASLRISQTIRRDETDLARLVLRIACTDRRGRPARLPETLRGMFEPLLQRQ